VSLSEHQDQISADKLSNNMEVIPPISLTYATAVVLSERIPICNDFLCVKYIPGNENFNADHMSRNFMDLTEWKLKSEIINRICNHFFLPDIDLFASRLN
jgi:hypothetical protein